LSALPLSRPSKPGISLPIISNRRRYSRYRSICSAAITNKPKARWAATLIGPRTRTWRPPCSSWN